MFGFLIREITELTGKAVGYVADEIGDIASAISDIPDAFSQGYDSTNKPDENSTPPTAD